MHILVGYAYLYYFLSLKEWISITSTEDMGIYRGSMPYKGYLGLAEDLPNLWLVRLQKKGENSSL